MGIVVITAVIVLLFAFASATAGASLLEYVERPDEAFSFEKRRSEPCGGGTAHTLRLTSQCWRGTIWEHWLTVFEPREVRHADKAMLLVFGGRNDAEDSAFPCPLGDSMAAIARDTGTFVAVLEQVPNQPLFGDLTEDEIIALTFENFIQSGESDWPLLLPMVKSAVRGMDAVQTFAHDAAGADIESFFVFGASKRGWTSWLTAVADPRVFGIAPMVIDVLNMEAQMRHQQESYGAYSDEIVDYTQRRLQNRMTTPEGRRLRAVVDPFSYRDRLALPKLVVLGTNDPYWTVDASSIYFPHLPGEKHLYYEPNAGHDIEIGRAHVIGQFYGMLVEGEARPSYHWESRADGLHVTWESAAGARLWRAASPTRDFREAVWTSEALIGDKECTAPLDAPDEGWAAHYVELAFSEDLRFCTPIHVAPDAYPELEKRV